MKKKLLSMLLAATMLGSLAGCGTTQNTKKGEVPTLTWLMIGSAQNDVASVLEKVNEITTEKIGAKIDLQFIDAGSYSEKMKMNMASGLDYDICFTGYVNNYGTAVEKGGLLDITEMLEKTPDLKASIPDYAWECVEQNGKIYAVPNQQIFATAYALVFRQDLLDKYGFDASSINHVEDIEPYLEQIKQNEPDYFPYRTNAGVTPWTVDVYDHVGSVLALPIGSTTADDLCFYYETEEFKQGIAKMHDWYQKGYIREDVLSVGDDTADYKNGKYAVTNDVWKPGVDEDMKSYLNNLDVSVVPYQQPYMTRGKATATMHAIGRNSKHPELALKFIELLNTDLELYRLICHGIEGKHYNLNEENKVVYVKDSGYCPNQSWAFGNTFNAYVPEGMDSDVWEQTKKVNDEARKSSLLGFVFDNKAVRTQITNITTVVDEYRQQFESGVSAPEEYYDEFIAKLKQAGQDKVMEEYKRQLTEYFAQSK